MNTKLYFGIKKYILKISLISMFKQLIFQIFFFLFYLKVKFILVQTVSSLLFSESLYLKLYTQQLFANVKYISFFVLFIEHILTCIAKQLWLRAEVSVVIIEA